jgi:phosphatidylethanolamine/phosphatidyl-N-methylethanolamine N-methyltransferase
MKPSAVASSYRRWAPIYDKTFGAVTHNGRRRACDYMSARGGDILEVGVGTGLALPFYGANAAVTGVDYSPEMLAKAEKRVAEERLDHVVALRQMDARALEFPDASFDFVAAMHVISVVPEPEQVMAEMARVCKPGGEVVIVNHFSSERGALQILERVTSPLENILGWQSSFPLETVLKVPELKLVESDSLPPMRMMTFLRLEKAA